MSPERKDKASRTRRRLIIRALEDSATKLLNPLPGRPPEKKSFAPSLFPQLFYQKEAELLKKSDLVIADLTEADFKMGFLISQALARQKPVLGLFWEALATDQLKNWSPQQSLFIDCFNQTNVRSVIRHFLHFIRQQLRLRGRFIVFDGLDGSGKSTQAKLLVNYLTQQGYRVKYIHFPRYQASFHGQIIAAYLKGKFGQLNQISPYLISLAYALDRLMAKNEIEDWLKAGYFVIADRYTSSNFAYQAARLPPKERKKFIDWLWAMEYRVHKLPREDLVVFLHLPYKLAFELIKQREIGKVRHQNIHEEDFKFMKEVEKVYLYLTQRFSHWVKINCFNRQNQLLTPETIQEKIIKILKRKELIYGKK